MRLATKYRFKYIMGVQDKLLLLLLLLSSSSLLLLLSLLLKVTKRQRKRKSISHFSPIDLNQVHGLKFFKELFWLAYIRGLGAATSYPGFLAFLISDFTVVRYHKVRKETLRQRLAEGSHNSVR